MLAVYMYMYIGIVHTITSLKVIPANSEYRVILNSSNKMIHDYKSTDRCTTVLDFQVGVGGSFYSEPSLGARATASWCKVMNCALHQLLT